MKYRLILFDFDGTLADSLPWFVRTFNQVAEKYGFKRIEPGNLEAVRRMGPASLLKYLEVPRWKLPLIAVHMRRLMARDIMEIRRFEGVNPSLAKLSHHGIMLALVTSNSLENVGRVLGLETLDLIPYRECDVGMFGKASRINMDDDVPR